MDLDNIDPLAWDPLEHPPKLEIRRQNESDDSDAEAGLGNVNRIVLRPPGHSGKAKRGHLSFDASFETGNLGRVDFISEFEYDLFIRPDICNPKHRMWFNFVVDNVRKDQRVIFNIVNLSKTKTLFRNGLTPLIRSSSRPKWQRMSSNYVYYIKSPEHRNHYVLTFAFIFDKEEDVYQFALTFPYSYSKCQLHLKLINQKHLQFFKKETLCYSVQERKVDIITISNHGTPEFFGNKRPKVIVLISRSHPGESPTSFIIQGLLDFLVSNHAIAEIVRRYLVLKIIPMCNPDGVFLGNHRCSVMGYDLNRFWNQASPWAHPVLHSLKLYLMDLDRSKKFDLDMVIDLHSHTSLLGTFIYGNSYDDIYRFQRHLLFPKLLAHNTEDYNSTYTMYNRDPCKTGTARRHLCEILRNTVNTYTLKVSVYGFTHPILKTVVPYTEEAYFRLGRNIVRTIADYYRITCQIPSSDFPQMKQVDDVVEIKKKKRLSRKSRNRLLILSRAKNYSQNIKQGDETESETDNESIRFTRRKDSLLWSNTKDMQCLKQPSLKNFDFSTLKPSDSVNSIEKIKKHLWNTTARKIGGGGSVGKQKRFRKAITTCANAGLSLLDFKFQHGVKELSPKKYTKSESVDTAQVCKSCPKRGPRGYVTDSSYNYIKCSDDETKSVLRFGRGNESCSLPQSRSTSPSSLHFEKMVLRSRNTININFRATPRV